MPRANHNLMEREFAGVADSSSEDADMRALYDAICKQKNLDEEQKRINNLRQVGQEVLDKCGYAEYNEITV